MGIVLVLLGIGLLYVSWKSDDKTLKVWFLVIALANFAGFIHMVWNDFEHTYTLLPNEAVIETPR